MGLAEAVMRMLNTVKFNLVLVTALIGIVHAQNGTLPSELPYKVGENSKRFKQYSDSIRLAETLYKLPIFGNEVQKKGYDLPLPAGLMLGYYMQEQQVVISDLAVGFGDSDLIDIDDLVEFEEVRTNSYSFTIRPDVYIFPFLNVYGILNRFYSRSNVRLSQPFELTIPEVDTEGYGYGMGATLAYGTGPYFVALNGNFVWSDTDKLLEPVFSQVYSIRTGYTYHGTKRIGSASFWFGVNYMDYGGTNSGSYDLTQLIPDDGDLLDGLKGKLEDIQNGLNDRYEEFCSMPGNGPKCGIIDNVIDELKGRVEDKLDGIDRPDELRINYALSTNPAENINLVAGAQFNLNRRWQLRTEFGFVNRTTLNVNLNYRFGFLKR